MYKLSICIPTYNRAKYLKENLCFLIPQIENKENVEVIIVDNASEDNTKEVVEEYVQNNKNVRYYKNPTNLGYSGNQLKCFEYAQGEYCAILCDDDIYLDGCVELILKHMNNKYVFIALNYCAFIKDPQTLYKVDFAPKKDVVFKRAYDIMNYPSVGHFSGFIFNRKLATVTLKNILMNRTIESYEKYRGIINDLAVRMTLASDLESCFIGERKLANRAPEKIDYDIIHHQCLEYYEYFYDLFKEGLINKKDLKYRARLVLNLLPRAIFRDIPNLSKDEIKKLIDRFVKHFKLKPRFIFISFPLLLLAQFSFPKKMYLSIYKLKHLLVG